ncbi:NAD(P)-dependent oxidoreductase [Candidatus Pelagibacter sp.]|nr:NAD(P)-dependent oxidoreductase [Candidatus Pelagibacter sp.]
MILVTGCTGYLGFHICEHLKAKKIPFYGIDNFSRSSQKNIIDKKKILKIDISSKHLPKLLKQKKIQTVIHAAAYSFPPESEDNKKIYYKNNILKTKIFIDNCYKMKIKKFIFFSSSNVYNFNSHKIKSVKETQKLYPKNYYGQTKLIIERYLNNKFDICYILRLFNIAGYVNKSNFYEFKNKYRRILPVINEAFRKKLTFKLNLIKLKDKAVFPGRDFVHIKDFLKIIFLIIKKQDTNNFIFNVGNNKLVYLDEIINIFEKKLKRKIYFKKIISTKGNLNYTLGNNALIKKKLNFDFKLNFNEIIKSCINKKII